MSRNSVSRDLIATNIIKYKQNGKGQLKRRDERDEEGE
jgi:hypothetical protein